MPTVCANAAKGGHADILRYAHEHGAKWTAVAARHAAAGAHTECLAYLVAQGAPLDAGACAAAAARGHLPTLRWLREAAGCAWGFDTCARAAEAGHVSVLAYAYEHDCAYDAKALVYWAANDDVRAWIAEHR
jgi:hypothetical protein